jgi:chitin synthase
MITSFIQYLLMAPSYIAVLNVYAFANVHDVSWGTKGDNAPQKLEQVSSGKGENKNTVEVAGPTSQKDLNALYEDAIHVLNTKPPKEEPKVNQSQKEEDYYKSFRTKYVINSPDFDGDEF